jgi:hypothetical protein
MFTDNDPKKVPKTGFSRWYRIHFPDFNSHLADISQWTNRPPFASSPARA